MNRMGSLPEEVLCHILSFLTTKEAALTSILSKRWRNLFTLVPNLDIDDSVFLNPEEEGKREREGILQSFMDFVDRVLSLQGDTTPIKRFSLKCKTGIDTNRVNRWISTVLQRGVTNLDLVLDFPRYDDDDSDYMYLLPDELFESTKLVELSLRSEFGVDWWRESTFLPMLKTLCFESKWIVLCDLDVFLSGFPALEEFYMAEIEWSESDESVSSGSLRKCTIYATGFEDFQNPKSISFDTPNLVYLEYSDFVAADYPKVNMPHLDEAVLGLKLTEHQIDLIRAPDDEDFVSLRLGNVWKLLSGLRNVEKLFISAETLELLSVCCESMPVFKNLKTLRIVCDADLGWQAMPALLRNCPHLQTLILKGLLHHVTDKCGDVCDCIPREDKGRSLSSCPVKKLQIRGFKGTVREKEMIRHFLESFPCLDEMEVYADSQNDNNDPSNVEANRIYKIVAFRIHKVEEVAGAVLQSKSMSQTQMEELSSQFTPRNNRMYDMVFMMHAAPPPPPPPPPQEMSEDYLKEQLDAANTKLAELKEEYKERQRVHDEEYKERQRVQDAMFDNIVNQYPMIASALKARQSATDSEGSNEQEKKRDVETLVETMADLYPDFASAPRASRGTDLERGEPSGDQGEMAELDQTTTSTAAVATDDLPRDGP